VPLRFVLYAIVWPSGDTAGVESLTGPESGHAPAVPGPWRRLEQAAARSHGSLLDDEGEGET